MIILLLLLFDPLYTRCVLGCSLFDINKLITYKKKKKSLLNQSPVDPVFLFFLSSLHNKVVIDMEVAVEGELHHGPLDVDTAVSLTFHLCI